MSEHNEKIGNILNSLPSKPGCYLMKDEAGKVIYIGKAVNLRNRVRSYFHVSANHEPRIRKLVSHIQDIEWIVVGSELEALILEMNLIKKHRPHYNVRLKDDKRYPYIKVHWADPFPTVTVTRQMVQDGSRYYGPYTSVWAVHQTLDLLRRIFPYLTCDREITGKDERACLYYDIKLCSAPCIGKIDQASYRQMIGDLCQFLEGRTENVITRLRTKMEKASEEMQYETAATLRDQIRAIEAVVERQKIISSDYIDSDVLALARSDGDAVVQVFFVRGGKLIGRDYFLLEGAEENSDADVMSEFIKQFYSQTSSVPPQVLLPHEVEEAQIIRQWLNQRRDDQKVELVVPHQGLQQELIDMAVENAVETLRALQAQWRADRHRQEQALGELQAALELEQPLGRVECYDISNIQGTAAVGGMVVFEQGVPRKNLYRRFNIRSVSGPDDFASMEEVLTRRFNRWKAAQETAETPGKKPDQAFYRLPDLLIVDGGKGQLSRAVAVLEKFNLAGKIPVAGLAKQNEELFLPGKPLPLVLARHSQALYLVQRIRDEAHRFAITAHRQQRTKAGLASRLDKIPGIGPTRRKALLARFGSIEGILNASQDELILVNGINPGLAQTIKEVLE
ncbi:MAG: excinuclease ABC subunit C [Anaerolineae bacterium UTCFX2]|jgi:excinuclease ABC subunit C|nr:MAG: excinuclease ABC subunit C [Anaerolineae bacterium UTCFX2]